MRALPTIVYDRLRFRAMEDEEYRFDESAYDALGYASISWQSVLDVLHTSGRTVRAHIGSVLRIAGRDRTGRLLAVALIEEDDDRYLVVAARELHENEAAMIARLIDERNGDEHS
jgi:hypothetical protein